MKVGDYVTNSPKFDIDQMDIWKVQAIDIYEVKLKLIIEDGEQEDPQDHFWIDRVDPLPFKKYYRKANFKELGFYNLIPKSLQFITQK